MKHFTFLLPMAIALCGCETVSPVYSAQRGYLNVQQLAPASQVVTFLPSEQPVITDTPPMTIDAQSWVVQEESRANPKPLQPPIVTYALPEPPLRCIAPEPPVKELRKKRTVRTAVRQQVACRPH